jgi:hypothetical protein
VPVVEPLVDERQLGRIGLDEHRGERSAEASSGFHAGWSSLGRSGMRRPSGYKRAGSVSS